MTARCTRVLLDLGVGEDGSSPRDDLSGVVAVGTDLWLASDEGGCLERLTRDADGAYGSHHSVTLRDLVRVPDPDEEIDVEGLAVDEGWLWVVGSHSARRKLPDDDESRRKRLRRLARVESSPNRHLLARIPLLTTEDGRTELRRELADDHAPRGVRTAAQLRIGRRRGALARALRDDEHLAPFLEMPGKDNGFNIEGIAARGARVLLGLRGPVLRGFAVVLDLELRTDRDDDSRLRLRRIGPDGRRYRKHFLDLCGLGVRELVLDGDDLLILAAPTMTLDGRAAVFRWRDALHATQEEIVGRDRLELALELPYGLGDDEGVEHPEGMTLTRTPDGRRALLLVYDAPHARRHHGASGVDADLFPID